MDKELLSRHLEEQAGVVARRQVVAAGFNDDFIERQVRRREWTPLHRGVYVNHTGEPTREQRAWAAVLFYWPAALCHTSALWSGRQDENVSGSAGGAGPVHVAIEHPRNGASIDGVRLHRLVNLASRVHWNTSPPRLRLDEAVLDVCAGSPTRSEALAVAADACQQRRTTALRLLAALDARQRLRHGTWLRAALADIASGAMSVLEQAYLHRVERAHGLPRARRQLSSRTASGIVYRDVEYEQFSLVVELDGRIGHELVRDRWKDQDRDLDAAGDDLLTLRIGWTHVEDQACRTAMRISRVLRRRGWAGAPTPCDPSCPIASEPDDQPGRMPADDAGKPPDKPARHGR